MGRRVTGVGVSPGTAVGRIWVLHPELLPVVAEPIPPERVDEEIRRFEEAREVARQEIDELKERVREALGGHYAGILEAQLLILDDPRMVQETGQRVRIGRVSASWALKEVVGEFLRRFDAVDDPYLRERGGELEDVHRRMQRLLRAVPDRESEMPDGPVIVVAHSLGPSDAVALVRRGTVGLATDSGGPTSHTAILAQALSVPAVAALQNVSRQVRNGDSMIVDGDTGTVLLEPTEEELERAAIAQADRHERERKLYSDGDEATVTADGVRIELRANIEFPHEIETVRRFGAHGIGLYRSEFLFLTHAPQLPNEKQHFETYCEIAEHAAPHPAVLRTLDLGGEKYFHEVLDRNESNPVLGLRAVRLCLQRPDIFRPQLRGLLRAAARHDNLQVLIPLVVRTDEILQVRRMLAEETENLKSEGLEARGDVRVGIMIEVPAAAGAADILARQSDFFAIGTNDLIQYSLAVDRGNQSVAHLYQPLHPGILRMLRFVIQSAATAGIPVWTCGEMSSDPAIAGLLVGLGLREMSMQPRALPAVREALRKLKVSDAEALAARALDMTASEVHRHLKSMA